MGCLYMARRPQRKYVKHLQTIDVIHHEISIQNQPIKLKIPLNKTLNDKGCYSSSHELMQFKQVCLNSVMDLDCSLEGCSLADLKCLEHSHPKRQPWELAARCRWVLPDLSGNKGWVVYMACLPQRKYVKHLGNYRCDTSWKINTK